MALAACARGTKFRLLGLAESTIGTAPTATGSNAGHNGGRGKDVPIIFFGACSSGRGGSESGKYCR